MSGGLPARRIAVFVVFAALAAAAGIPVVRRPASAPPGVDLKALESQLTSSARLHPAFQAPVPAGPGSWCGECHAGLPHPGTGVAAAMLNEHAGRMDCLLCHWPAAGGQRPPPSWQVPAGRPPFLAVLPRERSSKEALTALRAAAMAGRPCFARGPDCVGCHQPGMLGALLRPGSTPARAAALERLENYFTLAPGEKWYFPDFQR